MIIKTIKNIVELSLFTEDFKWRIMSFDTEATDLNYTRLNIEGFSCCDGEKAFYVDLINNPDKDKILQFLKKRLGRVELLIAQNISFDLKVLHKYGIHPNCKLYDTMVADHLLEENRNHGLKEMATKILGVQSTAWGEIKNHQSEEFYKYAVNDAIWCFQIYQIQVPQLKEQRLMDLFESIEMPFQWVLVEMAINGVKVDKVNYRFTIDKLKESYQKIKTDMYEFLGENRYQQKTLFGGSFVPDNINFNSAPVLIDILFKRLKLTVVEHTPGGNPSVGKFTLEKYKDHPFIKLLNQYKIIQKLLTSFFDPLPSYIDPDDKIRANFRDTGTVTGRLSSDSPNMQQLPNINRDFPIDTRQCFIASEGYKMITCDYSGQELRILTEVSQEPVLIDTFNKGKDMHLSTANDFFDLNIPEEELYKTHPKFRENKERFKAERNKAKTINFGMAYGKAAFGFSKDFDISEKEAQEILNKYFAALPNVKKAIDRTHNQVRGQGYVTSMFGRRRRFYPATKNGWTGYPSKAFRQSFNFLIQGAAADMIRKAAIATKKLSTDNPEWDLRILMMVHDECVYEVKEQYIETAAKAIKECFENAVQFCIPVLADVSIGNNYSEAK